MQYGTTVFSTSHGRMVKFVQWVIIEDSGEQRAQLATRNGAPLFGNFPAQSLLSVTQWEEQYGRVKSSLMTS